LSPTFIGCQRWTDIWKRELNGGSKKMGRIIALAVLMTSGIMTSPQTKAQQANLSQQAIFRQTQDAAMATAAGPEFCQQGPCPGFENVAALHRSMMSSKTPKPVDKAKASGPFPPQPYQPSRSELQAAAQAQQPRSSGGAVRVDDDATGYSPQLEARANAIFGKGNVGNESARQRWMADQEQRAIANEINRTKPLLYPVSGR
jgi:hypothetical protein